MKSVDEKQNSKGLPNTANESISAEEHPGYFVNQQIVKLTPLVKNIYVTNNF